MKANTHTASGYLSHITLTYYYLAQFYGILGTDSEQTVDRCRMTCLNVLLHNTESLYAPQDLQTTNTPVLHIEIHHT